MDGNGMAAGELTDAEVFGAQAAAPPARAQAPDVGYGPGIRAPDHDSGHGVQVWVGNPYAGGPGPATDAGWSAPEVHSAPPAAAAAPKELSDADVFGSAGPGQGAAPVDTRPVSQILGAREGVNTVGKNLIGMLSGALPGTEGTVFNRINPLTFPMKVATNLIQGGLDKQAETQRPGKIGKFVGEVLASAPFGIDEMGAIPLGMMQGALTSESADPFGKIRDIALGGVGGKVGDAVLGGASRLLAPVVRPAVQTLIDAKIPLTVGQIAGGTLKRVEDGMTSLPILGDMIKNAQFRGVLALNRAIPNRALAPIGESLPADIPSGREAVAKAGDVLSDRYTALAPKLTVKPDQQFADDLVTLGKASTGLPKDHARLLKQILQENIADHVDPSTGIMSGTAMKDADSVLSQEASDWSNSPNPGDRKLGKALGTARQNLRALVVRSNPQAADELAALNEGWANLAIGEKAASSLGAHEGLVTPSQLAGAVKGANNTVRKRGYARGEALMQDLSDAAVATMPSSVPDSGSPLRHAIEAGVGVGVAKESGLGAPLAKALAMGALIGIPYTKLGQAATQGLLTGGRPQAAKDVARLLEELRPLLAYAGGTAAPQVAPALQALPAR